MNPDQRGRTIAAEGGTPRRADFLPFGQPLIGEDEIADVVAVLRSGWIGMGERTRKFERAFASYVDSPYAVAFSSGTAALHASLVTAGIGAGDEVITTSLTFAATVNAIVACGAAPVLADIEPDTLNLSAPAAAAAITPRTRAIMPVHFGGLPCDLDALAALADEHGLLLIEDAAHAAGAVYGGRRIGGTGNPVCFSFYPTKNMTTAEGGMVTTADADFAEELRLLRLHGLSSDAWRRFGAATGPIAAEVVRPGFKYNMTDVNAALGLGQLRRLEDFLGTRERYANLYDEALDGLPLDRQPRPAPGGDDRHGLHLYVVLLRLEQLRADRDQVVRALRAENIGASVHYVAIHRQPYYGRTLPFGAAELPAADSASDRILSLPLSPAMTPADVEDVVEALKDVLNHYAAVPARTGSVT